MIKWLGISVLMLTLLPDALALPPIRPGFPMCPLDTMGYWQPYIEYDKERNAFVNWTAITSVNFLDPSTIICWLEQDTLIHTVDPETVKQHTNPTIDPPPNPHEQALAPTIGALRHVWNRPAKP